MATTALPTHAAPIQDCPAPPGAVNVALPSGFATTLRDKTGNVALPGEPFNVIDDYVKGQPNRRCIFAWNIGSRWIVATEVGGIALRAAVSMYDLGKDGKTVAVLDNRMTSPTCACATPARLRAPK